MRLLQAFLPEAALGVFSCYAAVESDMLSAHLNPTRPQASNEQRHGFAALLAEMCKEDRRQMTRRMSITRAQKKAEDFDDSSAQQPVDKEGPLASSNCNSDEVSARSC
jgi:hypothetical protein